MFQSSSLRASPCDANAHSVTNYPNLTYGLTGPDLTKARAQADHELMNHM